ncbi:sulfatase [Aestuariivirga litoralis]|uniref:Sulfatase n=1 Tax=Aestuariivirga litoralis TaxID=2650924 RepID=A0A2W2B7R2_9HYPH|nr:arylsulfatase [Aestuariivirga litoralis]PZF76314.1 sulfatase [Aestuariivirga litoralis]
MTHDDGVAKGMVQRRGFLAAGASLLSAAVLSRVVSPALAENARPPNIIYIMADDLGWKDVGFHGSDIATPVLDGLARAGAQFDAFYAQPMCTPSRAAFLTGRYPLRYGLQTGVIPSAGSYGLSTDEYLLPQLLKDAGYETALVGKWHLGHGDTRYWPRQRGFDHFYGALVGEIDHFEHASHGVKDWYRDNQPLDEEGYDNTLFGNEASRLIRDRTGDKPLFLYLAFTAPHSPFQAPEDHVKRYAHIADEQRRLYAAMVTAMDDAVGQVLKALDEKGLREDTVIVFQSDNGGVRSAMFAGESKVGDQLPADNGGFRDGKGTLYEGGTRVVGFMNWPGHIKPGVVEGLSHVVDMYPTLAAIAGAKMEKNKPLDGINLWPAISEGTRTPREEVVYNVDPTGGAVRQGNMKLVWNAGLPGKVELFDIAKDPGETTNLAEQDPGTVARLKERILALSQEMSPPLLIMEAIKLTFGAPPVAADPATMFNQMGD